MKHSSLIVFFFYSIQALGQVASVSPYSRYGLGDLSFDGFASQIGMGGVSAAFSDSTCINFYNPASLANLSFTVFEAAGKAEIVEISTAGNSNVRNSATFAYLSLAFPIIKGRWGGGFGLVPFSEKGYELEDQELDPIIGTLQYKFSGSGGLSRFYIGNGFRIGNNLTVGLNASYIFGSLIRNARLEFPDNSNVWNTRYEQSVSFGDFYFDYGLQYKLKMKNKRYVLFGFSGVIRPEVNAVFSSFSYNYEKRGSVEILKDTVSRIDDLEGKVRMPQRWSFGAAYVVSDNWQFVADYSWQNWSRYNSFSERDTLSDSYRISAGVLFKPTANYSSGFWRRVDYRIGAHYGSSFIDLNNTAINDIGVALGLGLPIRRSYYSKFQIAMEYGQRGTEDSGLIRENYFRVILGVTMNDKWFVKRKFE